MNENKKEKNKLIIVEGPQGTGKTTLTNYLRENISSSNLYRLSGQKDKSLTGKYISQKMYKALLDYLQEMQDVPMNLIFDRTFFTEEVYARLGYKDYEFTDVYEELLSRFAHLDYDIYYFSLYLKNVNLFEERLKRTHHDYQTFSLENSTKQQEIYEDIKNEVANAGIKVYSILMDEPYKAYEEVNRILKISLK